MKLKCKLFLKAFCQAIFYIGYVLVDIAAALGPIMCECFGSLSHTSYLSVNDCFGSPSHTSYK